MTRTQSISKVVLVAEPRPADEEPGGAPIRRFRIARLRFDGRETVGPTRFEHLKRVYD